MKTPRHWKYRKVKTKGSTGKMTHKKLKSKKKQKELQEKLGDKNFAKYVKSFGFGEKEEFKANEGAENVNADDIDLGFE